ncbi:MAG TPA: AAA family ATPase [Acidobacteriaceae bacterium]|jgi:general secretion pathway protein A|nr:AAA family ATPase [Acidobacteriaceae bacterium]
MILDYYNLREQPFGSTPDPRYFYASETHREALASLLYGIDAGRGFLALIAQPGMGKTTLVFRCLAQMQQELRTVFLFQTICTPLDFLRLLLIDLGVEDVSGGVAELQSKLIQIVMEQSATGTKLVIVVDEAQNLDNSVLELIRMLSNFETSQQKLMHIVLCGQPQLARKLASPEMVQLRQRISIIARLEPFTPEQTAAYVDHRLEVAGWNSDTSLFDDAAMKLIVSHSGGLPRNINNLCFNALSLGCVLRRKAIDADIIQEVVRDLEIEDLTEDPAPRPRREALSPVRAEIRRPVRLGWLPRALVASALTLALSGVTAPRPASAATHAPFVDSTTALVVAPPLVEMSPPPDPVLAIHASPGPRVGSPVSPEVRARQPIAHLSPRTNDDDRILVPPGVALNPVDSATAPTSRIVPATGDSPPATT